MGFLKDLINTTQEVIAARKAGTEGELAVVRLDELIDSRYWLAQRDWENQLMQACIKDHITYKASPCEYCEEHRLGECKSDQHGKRGCGEWWLRMLTEDELQMCAARATARPTAEKPAP